MRLFFDERGNNVFDSKTYYSRLLTYVAEIRKKTDFRPEVAIVLGSGLGDFAKNIEIDTVIEYGELPGKVNEEIRKMAIGDDEVLSCRPADQLKPELESIKEQYSDIAKSEEDILSCAMFPQVAPEYIKKRDNLDVREITVDWIRN